MPENNNFQNPNKMKSAIKRIYHPMFIALYMMNVLDKNIVFQIPKSTRHQWQQTHQADMFGFEYISNYTRDLEAIKEMFEVSFLRRTSKAICKVYRCFRKVITEIKGYKAAFNKHTATILETIDHLITISNVSIACKLFNISTQKFYRLKNKLYCTASIKNLCYKLHPQQLTLKEIGTIKQFLISPENMMVPLSTIYFSILNSGKSFFSLSTFYKYCGLLGEKRKFVKEKKVLQRFQANRIFEFLHVDITNVQTINEGVCKVAFIKDNFSKACLYSAVLANGTSFAITEHLKRAFEKYDLFSQNKTVNIVCDGGPENKGELDLWTSGLKHPPTIKLTARTTTFPFSNNMSESIHHVFKNVFLRGNVPYDKDALKLRLKEFEHFYGHVLYPIELCGYTTQQVLNGALPDKHRFTLQIETSKKMRVEENRRTGFCNECLPTE